MGKHTDVRVKAHRLERDDVLVVHLNQESRACLSDRTRVNAFSRLSEAARTIALPTTTPSATFAAATACEGCDTPKPTQIGSSVAALKRAAVTGRSCARASCVPVTPSRLMR